MELIKEFFNKRTFINCMVFSMPVSLLITWRFLSLNHMKFFTADAGEVYLFFLALGAGAYLLLFFVLYLLSKRKQEE